MSRKHDASWTVCPRPMPGGDLFQQMTALEFHEHIGPEGRKFFAELAQAFGDAHGPRRTNYFLDAQRVWTVCDRCTCTLPANKHKPPKCWEESK